MIKYNIYYFNKDLFFSHYVNYNIYIRWYENPLITYKLIITSFFFERLKTDYI